MSNVIEDRIVKMEFDNSKFEENAKTSLSTIDKLKQALKFDGASRGLEEVSHAAGNLKLEGISDACDRVTANFSAFQVAAITVLANITNEAYEAGKKIVSALTIDGAKDGFSEYEQKMGSVQTIMNSTGESLNTVMGYLEELNKYADQTIYSFSDMTTNIGKFTNAGVKLEDAVAAIKGVSNEAALSGANANEASRAMYNFAQALSAGYVKLIDWKSIENANMATVEFKNELIETAVALGTVVKEGELYRSTTTNAKGQTSELFDATHAFNDALNAQWMTTEVLTKTLGKYADESTDLGKKAYAAAQDVKTFSMMMDTLKEAIGSGWAVTWEKLVGDFEHAKKMFTGITNAISGVIEAQAEARNKFVEDAFNKEGLTNKREWDTLSKSITATGANLGQFKKTIIEVAAENGVAVKDLVQQYGSFENSLESGWLTSDIFEQTVTKIQKLGDVSPEFSKLAAAVSTANKPFQRIREEIDMVSGRTLVIDGLTNMFKALINILKPVQEAFRNIFPAKTGDDLHKLLENFEKFTETLEVSEDVSKRIKMAFEGFFKVLSKGINVVKDILSAFSPLIDIAKILAKNFLIGAEELGKFFNTMSEGDDSTSNFSRMLNGIHDTLQAFADNLQSYIDKAKNSLQKLRDMISESWDTGALSILATIIDRLRDSLSSFTDGVFGGLKNFFKTMGEDFDGSGFEKISSALAKFGEGLKKVWDVLKGLLSPIIDKLKTFFSEFDLIDSAAVTLGSGGISIVVALLGRFIDNILDFKDQVGVITNPVEAIAGIVQQLTDLFGSIEEKIRTDVVKNFAISVGILAASMYVLSTIDADAAGRSIAELVGLLTSVIGVFVAINKITSSVSTSPNKLVAFFENLGGAITGSIKAATLIAVANAIQKMAISVGILAVSMKLISDIPVGQMVASFAVISALLWELVGVTKVLTSTEGKLVKGASALLTMGTSILILSAAMKVIASIDSDSLLQSFLVLSSILLELTIFMQVLDGNSGVKGAASLVALSTAILALSGAMKVFESMDWEGIGKGLVAIAGLLIELGVALTFMDASLPGAAALIIASGALLVLAGAMKVLETISWEGIGKGLVAIGGLLIELALGLTAMSLALPGAAALVVAAKGIAILTPALVALAMVPTEKIASAIGKLALALVSIGLLSAVLGIVSPLILAFALALGVLSVAIVGIGVGVAAAGAGLLALGTALGLLAEIGKESAERIVETLQIILNGIIMLIPNMVKAIGEGIIGIAEVVVKGGPTIKAAITTIVDILIQVFEESIPKLSNAFYKMLVSLATQASIYTPILASEFLLMIQRILKVFKNALPDLIQSGVDIMVAFIQGVQSASNQLIDAAMTAIISFINGLADSIERHTPELIAATKKLFNAIIDAMLLILFNGNPKLAKEARNIMDSIRNAIFNKISSVVEVIGEMMSKMLNKVSEKTEQFKEAGRNAIQGFINGVKEKISDAANAVKDVGSNALETLRKTLLEHSPSKATYKIGDFFDQGFINAISDGEDNVAKASSHMGETALMEVQNALAEGIDVTPTITPVLDLSNIEKGTSEINKISGEWDNLAIGTSTSDIAVKASNTFTNPNFNKVMENQNGFELLKSAINALGSNEPNMTQNNTFNISGDDPRAIADEVSRVLQMQVERRGAVWA